MYAITVKYFGPSNVKGSRLRATCGDLGSVTIPYPHELSGLNVYAAAAAALCEKFKWRGTLAGGWTGKSAAAFVLAGAAAVREV